MPTRYQLQVENFGTENTAMWFVPVREDGSLDQEHKIRVNPLEFVESSDKERA